MTPNNIAPVQQQERILIIDILRGFALLGIFLVNMPLFNQPFQSVLLPTETAVWYDQIATWLIHFLAEGKFYAMFSILFGLGLTLLMERIEARGGRFIPLYMRRLFFLLLFGLVHALLIWVGDILIMYALLGFLLIPFRKAKPRTLLIWAAIFISLPLLFNIGATALVQAARTVPEAAVEIDQSFLEVEASYRDDKEQAALTYAQGSFAEITAQRLYDYRTLGLPAFFALGFNVLAFFLIGMYLGKRKIFQNLAENRPLLRKLLLWGLLIGLPANALYATIIMSSSRIEPTWPLVIALIVQTFGAPLLSLAYMSGLALLYQLPSWQKRLDLFAPVGQMALTNYLLQSIISTLIFYGYGLAFFGQVGAALGLGLTFFIYGLQIPFSHWWMKRFKYGSAEWLWRSLTYLTVQPIKRPAASAN